MMKSTMRPIHSLIDADLLTRAQSVQSLSTSLRSRLSYELKLHCWVVEVIGNTLVIVTDNAERASILRYQQHELIKQINEEFSQQLAVPVRRLKIKVDYNLTKLNEVRPQQVSRSAEDVETAQRNCKQLLDYLK